MAEYIDKKDAIEATCFNCSEKKICGGSCDDTDRLRLIPAADVRPVVRCADCKWFQSNMRKDGYLPDGVPEFECRHWCGPCDPTDFCSYGARMDGDGDV